jgi:tetratricopeptide (TPR) repeat protein
MKLDPSDPAPGLNLGNLLREQRRLVEAEAAYRWAVKVDPRYAPAWHNLADMLEEAGRLPEAVDCEQRALDADPKYADAVFNMALFLQQLERHAQAAPLWRRYLELDRDSPWAERAKRALKYCEIQMVSLEAVSEAGGKDLSVRNV